MTEEDEEFERIKELIKQATTIEEHKWGVSYDTFDK